MRCQQWVFVGLLFAIGCGSEAKKASQAAEAKQAEEKEIDQRAKVIATQVAQQVGQDVESKRAAEAQQALAAREALRQRVADAPAYFFDVSNVEVVGKGAGGSFRHLSSLSLTNNSKFVVTDPHGTLEFHSGVGSAGDSDNVIANVPIELTGSIAPGASMVFSEQQHTLSGAAIQLAKTAEYVSFTVTGAKTVGSEKTVHEKDAPPGLDGGEGL